MKPWAKTLLILGGGFIAVVLALLGRAFWWGREKPIEAVYTPPPTPAEALTVEGLHPPALKPEWEAKMRAYEERAHWLDTPTWVTETVETTDGRQVDLSFWQVPLVSTGEREKVTVTLQDGRQFDLDVLYTLQVNVTRNVVMFPFVASVSGPGGTYQFLDQPLETGRVMLASADSPLATPQGFQWAKCTPLLLNIPDGPDWLCDLGQAVEAQWPGYTALALRRILAKDDVPENFFLYGLQAIPLEPPPIPDPTMPNLSTWEVQP